MSDRLRALVTPMPWEGDAACKGVPSDVFFPHTNSDHPQGLAAYNQARLMCGECTVQEECLEWALENDERFGMWGGLSPTERNELVKETDHFADSHNKAQAKVRAQRVKEAQKMKAQGMTIKAIATELGVASETVHRYLADGDRHKVLKAERDRQTAARKERADWARKLHAEGLSIGEVAEIVGVSHESARRYIRA